MNVLRNVFLALGTVSSLVLITAGVVGYLLTGPAPVQWPTAPLPVDDGAAGSLDDAIEAFSQEVEDASPGDRVTLVLLEDEVNSKLNQLAAAEELPLRARDIRVHFLNGALQASAMTDLGIDVQVAIEAQVAVEEGKPRITIQEFYLGRLPIPKTLTDNIIAALMGQAGSRLEALPFELDRIDFGEDWMVIGGEARPASIGASAAGLCPEPSASSACEPVGTGSAVD